MSSNEGKEKSNGLEIFKTASTFIASVVIAATGLLATRQYNLSQLEISRNKILTELIPKLGEPDANVRKFSAMALALYGKHAVPALMPTLTDVSGEVRLAGVQSLSLIGAAAINELTKAYTDRRNSINVRGSAIYALGLMRAPKTYELAAAALENPKEDPDIRKDAATALGFLREKRATQKLLTVLRQRNAKDPILAGNIVIALGEIEDTAIVDSLVGLRLHEHSDENVRLQTMWALGKRGDENVLNILSQVESEDASEKVRQTAKWATASIKRRS